MQNKTDGPSLTTCGPEPRMEADHVKQLSVRVIVRGEVQGAMGTQAGCGHHSRSGKVS